MEKNHKMFTSHFHLRWEATKKKGSFIPFFSLTSCRLVHFVFVFYYLCVISALAFLIFNGNDAAPPSIHSFSVRHVNSALGSHYSPLSYDALSREKNNSNSVDNTLEIEKSVAKDFFYYVIR